MGPLCMVVHVLYLFYQRFTKELDKGDDWRLIRTREVTLSDYLIYWISVMHKKVMTYSWYILYEQSWMFHGLEPFHEYQVLFLKGHELFMKSHNVMSEYHLEGSLEVGATCIVTLLLCGIYLNNLSNNFVFSSPNQSTFSLK